MLFIEDSSMELKMRDKPGTTHAGAGERCSGRGNKIIAQKQAPSRPIDFLDHAQVVKWSVLRYLRTPRILR